MTQTALPLHDDEAGILLADLEGRQAVALAVSGGPDSLALLDLVQRWSARRPKPPALVVLTVDHGLRPGSAAEAAMVARVAQARGLRHETLLWTGPKPETGVEAAARDARYCLLEAAAQRFGASVLVTAHHREDQAETVLMRLSRGSGLSGLGGMRTQRVLGNGVVLVRPLLDMPKARLVATALAAGLEPVEDEMNADRRFARARLRGLLPQLAREGIDAAALARAARLFRRADEALAGATRAFLSQNLTTNALGIARIDRAVLAREAEEIRRRALGAIIAAAGGSGEAPGEEALGALDMAIRSPDPFRRTLGGAVIRTRGRDVVIHREPGRMQAGTEPVPAGHTGRWDGRFEVEVGPVAGVTLGPLAAAGYAELPRDHRPRPRAAAETVPAFRRGGRLLAVPSVGFVCPGGESIVVREDAVSRLCAPSRS